MHHTTTSTRGRITSAFLLRLAPTTIRVVVGLALVALPASAQRSPTGHFEVRQVSRDGSVEICISDRDDGGRHGRTSFGVEPNALHGLSASQLADAYRGPIHFTLVRDAGTITFDGQAAGGEGVGTYSFVANPSYATNLASRGHGRPSESEQFELALFDVGYPFLDELRTQRYPTATVGELVKMGHHGVDAEFVHDMGALHYQLGTVAVLTTFRDHGVDPEFIRDLQKAGYSNIAPDELLTLRDHGVDGHFIGDLARVGFAKPSTDELLTARDHGVSASFVDGIKRAGYSGFSLADFVRLRDHGVTPSFARRMRERTSSVPSAQDLMRAMDHGDDDGD